MKRRAFLKGLISIPSIIVPSISLAKPNTISPKIVSKNPLLYLEVSARRSGKTKRLVEHMCNYIEQTGSYVYFTSCNINMTRQIIDEYIPPKYKIYIIPLIPAYNFLRKNYITIDSNLRIYYDEIDLLDNKYVFINNNNYYVGTPYRQNGTLKKLTSINNGNYTKYSFNGDFEAADNMRKTVDSNTWKREILGEFV